MHILIVSQYFWPESFRITDLAITLRQMGYQITVLTGVPNYPEGKFYKGYGLIKNRRQQYQGINIIRVPLVPRGNSSKLRLIANYFSYAATASLAALFLARKRPDVIFVFGVSPVTVGFPALVVKKLLRVPILFWVQDLWPESLSATGAIRSESILRWVGKMTRFIYSGCDRILVQSRAFIPRIAAMGVAESRLYYFPNSAEDIYQSTVADHTINLGCSADCFHVVFAGNIGAAQSFETILQAIILLKDHPDIHWTIIGEGSKKSWLLAEIDKHQISHIVHLIDRKPVEDMPYYYRQAGALLITLKRDPIFSLTVPSKLQSYLAAAKPIIASIDGEAARIIAESGAGFVGDAEDAQTLAQNVLHMHHTQLEEREAMGEKGRRYFLEHFDKQRLMTQLEQWITTLRNNLCEY